jgi:hypothetical protein
MRSGRYGRSNGRSADRADQRYQNLTPLKPRPPVLSIDLRINPLELFNEDGAAYDVANTDHKHTTREVSAWL